MLMSGKAASSRNTAIQSLSTLIGAALNCSWEAASSSLSSPCAGHLFPLSFILKGANGFRLNERQTIALEISETEQNALKEL